MWQLVPPECIKVGKPFKIILVRAPVFLSFVSHVPSGPSSEGTYLDVGRYPAINAQTDAHHRYGARLGLVDVTGDGKIPRTAQQFRPKIRHRPFSGCPDHQSSPSAVIPLMWGVLEYTLQRSRKTWEGIKYSTARSLQSAAATYHLWEKMLQFPGQMYRDRDNNVIGASHLSPTDSVIATLGNKGMRRYEKAFWN
jgi:hypothetical protein